MPFGLFFRSRQVRSGCAMAVLLLVGCVLGCWFDSRRQVASLCAGLAIQLASARVVFMRARVSTAPRLNIVHHTRLRMIAKVLIPW